MPLGETIVASATPPGESAIAAIRLSGDLCELIAMGVFKRKTSPKFRFAHFGAYNSLDGSTLDEVVYVYYPAPGTYTGEPMLEIFTHGNPFIVSRVLDDLVARGCRMADGGEFTRTAFLNDKMDLSQAEAVSDMIRARSDTALHAAQRQLKGALGDKMRRFMDDLLNIMAQVEAYIDFPDEDLPAEVPSGPVERLLTLINELEELIETHQYRDLLIEGIKAVIVGPPNAGKSSLLNALLGEERAIVSPIAGTTRDYITEKVTMGPYSVHFFDTAGLHEAGSELEQIGIKKTLEKLDEADFYIVMIDASKDSPQWEDFVLEHFTANKTLIIENKVDLSKKSHAHFLPDVPRCQLSLKTGEGLKEFRKLFIKTLEKDKVIPASDSLTVNTRHADALSKAKNALDKGMFGVREGLSSELIASDLREALDCLGDVIGKADNEDMLDRLFGTFCIGK